ncbi:MAG: pyridoxamine 5'-phosphate oxidase [Saprospiraceae bacterium]
MSDSFSSLRQDYRMHTLDEKDVSASPLDQFHLWFQEALDQGSIEPNAFVLSTVSHLGKPSSRTMLLKGVEDGGFVFFTNYESAKSNDLKGNFHASMLFLWLPMQRQIRIEGIASKLSKQASEEYFHSRPRESQIGAWVSPQSQIIPSRSFLDERWEFLSEKYNGFDVVPMPENWGGWRIDPTSVEFWQGRTSRLHDRVKYFLDEDKWIIQRIAP